MRFLPLLLLLTTLCTACFTYDRMESAIPPGESEVVLSSDSVTVYFLLPQRILGTELASPNNVEVFAYNQSLGPVRGDSYMKVTLPLDQHGTVHLSARHIDYANLRLTAAPGSVQYVHLRPLGDVPDISMRALGPLKGPEVLERCKRQSPVVRYARPQLDLR